MYYFFQEFAYDTNLGDGSPGFVLLHFVLGIGVTLLIPQASGKIPCWRHELYMYVSSKDNTSKVSLTSLVLKLFIADDLVIHIPFINSRTSLSVTHLNVKEEFV